MRDENPQVAAVAAAVAIAAGIGLAVFFKKRKAHAATLLTTETPAVAPPPVTVVPAVSSVPAADPFGNAAPVNVAESREPMAVEGWPGMTWADVQRGANRMLSVIRAGSAQMQALNEQASGNVPADLTTDGLPGPTTARVIGSLYRVAVNAQALNTSAFRAPYMGTNADWMPNTVPISSWVDPSYTQTVARTLQLQSGPFTYDDSFIKRLLWFSGKNVYGNGGVPQSNSGSRYLFAKAAKSVLG